MTRIAIIGGGKIGEALISGLLQAGHAIKDLVVAEQYQPRADELIAEYSIRVSTVADAAEGADVIVIAVKPNDVESALTALTKVDLDGDLEQLIVSLAAGIPTGFFETRLPAGFPVIRVMPNTPMLVGEGVSVLLARTARQGRASRARTRHPRQRRQGGPRFPNRRSTRSRPVSGSGPAYFFLVAEAMIDAGVGLGLTRPVATELVVQTMVGSAAMLDRTGDSATDLRAAVTSPGGTTAAALRQLEAGGLRTAFFDALDAAKSRSAAMGAAAD